MPRRNNNTHSLWKIWIAIWSALLWWRQWVITTVCIASASISCNWRWLPAWYERTYRYGIQKKNTSCHQMPCRHGNDPSFLDEWEYNCLRKSKIVNNAPLSNLHVHIIADANAAYSVVKKRNCKTQNWQDHMAWRNEVSLILNNVEAEEYIPIWAHVSHLNKALTNETNKKYWMHRKLGTSWILWKDERGMGILPGMYVCWYLVSMFCLGLCSFGWLVVRSAIQFVLLLIWNSIVRSVIHSAVRWINHQDKVTIDFFSFPRPLFPF